MCGNDVAVGLGTVEEAAMREKSQECTDAGKEPVRIKTYPDVAAGYRLVQNTRTDIMLSDLVLVDNMVAENPETFARAFWILSGFKIGAAVATATTTSCAPSPTASTRPRRTARRRPCSRSTEWTRTCSCRWKS